MKFLADDVVMINGGQHAGRVAQIIAVLPGEKYRVLLINQFRHMQVTIAGALLKVY